MVYLGMDNNKLFVINNLGIVVDEIGNIVIKDIHAITVNSLDVRRNDGLTWLHHINGIISFTELPT